MHDRFRNPQHGPLEIRSHRPETRQVECVVHRVREEPTNSVATIDADASNQRRSVKEKKDDRQHQRDPKIPAGPHVMAGQR